MEIRTVHLLEGARKARGLVVVIDVLRACSTLCYLFAKDVLRVWIAADSHEAFALRRRIGDAVLVGEEFGQPISGFHFNNSPAAIEAASGLRGREVVFCSSAGAKAILECPRASEVVTGCFVNARAVAEYIIAAEPQVVTLVCSGRRGRTRALEDELAARYLKGLIRGGRPSFDVLAQQVKRAPSAEKFFDVSNDRAPQRDLVLCTQDSIFDFVLRRTKRNLETVLELA